MYTAHRIDLISGMPFLFIAMWGIAKSLDQGILAKANQVREQLLCSHRTAVCVQPVGPVIRANIVYERAPPRKTRENSWRADSSPPPPRARTASRNSWHRNCRSTVAIFPSHRRVAYWRMYREISPVSGAGIVANAPGEA